jgi:outer membrane protein OmpA-like peptidoglycan-associated protein
MNRIPHLLTVALLAAGLGGCASYSAMVNSAAPAKQPSEVQLPAYEAKNDGSKPAFCEEPAAPAPAPAKVSEVYMVMPEDGGKAGTVDVIFSDGKTTTLHGDYSAMQVAGSEQKAFVGNEAQLKEMFGSAVSALPPAPAVATLYFLLGKDELTPDSKAQAESIYNNVKERQSPEVLVVGHTDTMGTDAHNQKLSVKRAEKVRQSLIKMGVPADTIKVSGRGEKELLVKTPDNTKEPKNRRVEINVR